MKTKITLFALLLFAFMCCKKDNTIVDPRDQFTGAYQLAGVTKQQETDDILIVTKSSKSNWLVLSLTKARLFAEMSDNGKFTLQQDYRTEYSTNGVPYGISTTGSGQFSNNTITLNLRQQSTPPGQSTQTISVTIIGAKQ